MKEWKIKCICMVICTILLCGTLLYCTSALQYSIFESTSGFASSLNGIRNSMVDIKGSIYHIENYGIPQNTSPE